MSGLYFDLQNIVVEFLTALFSSTQQEVFAEVANGVVPRSRVGVDDGGCALSRCGNRSVPRLARSMCVPFWYRRFLLEVVRE
jgi:hypothetical protein